MNITNETKVKDIAASSAAARQVLENAGVDYCCGGGKSVHEACLQANVPAEEILKRLRENGQGAGAEEMTWNSKPLAELTRHIRERHHRYVRESIARVRPLLEKVRIRHGEKHGEIAAIEGLFAEVSQEMIAHMQKEEQILFPYIEAIERSANGKGSLERPFFQTVQNPIHMMMKDHDSAGELVKQIRKASSEYTAPTGACASYEALYRELREFEADLHQHVHLENNILFPRAVEMEAAVVQRG